VPSSLKSFGAVVAEKERAVEQLRMSREILGLHGELEPGSRHRLVVPAWNARAGCDHADALGEPVESLVARVVPGEAPRNVKVPFMRELGGWDAPCCKILQ
jgi:hypothetical protein